MVQSTILIVDDDPISREFIEAILAQDGYKIEFACNGPEALEKVSFISPDLILLDVMMPEMDGLEVCRRLRAAPPMAEVPIIMLTSLEDQTVRLQGLESGADDFLSKPADRQELRARVRTITRLNRYRTLLHQRESLRAMAERVVTAQEEERHRISRELHDDLGQSLTAHALNLINLQRQLPLDRETLYRHFDNLIDETNTTLEKMRLLAQGLRPPVLDTLGLDDAVQACCAEFRQRTHLPVTVEIEPSQFGENIPDVYTITIYRILQEGLTNVAKHAQASQVWVELIEKDGTISLTIQDNGRGFDPQLPGSHGIGLTGIRERLALVNGELLIRTALGRGVILMARLPFRPNS